MAKFGSGGAQRAGRTIDGVRAGDIELLGEELAPAVSRLDGGSPRPPAVRRRQIVLDDLEAVAALLHIGFPSRSAACFLAALQMLAGRPHVDPFPRFGFLLEAGSSPAGVLLTICSEIADTTPPSVRCNMSCWYVAPQYRMFAPLLLLGLGRKPAATILNISPALTTLPTIEAQGFIQFSRGAFACVPAIIPGSGKLRISRPPPIDDATSAAACDGLAPFERKVLRDHESFGCISLVCSTGERTFPAVFRCRVPRRFPLPCAQLIYCRNIDDIAEFAGPIGRFLALRGMPWIYIAACAPLRGVPGRFLPAKLPMYFKGAAPPRAGDLAYTEAAMFGF